MSIITTRRFGLWWQLAMGWFEEKFSAILAALPEEATEQDIDNMEL